MHLVALTIFLSSSGAADRPTVLQDGVLRWADDGTEVALFGVNYYPPFSIHYQELRKLNIDHRKVIEQDVAHFVRLGLDVIRLHCWDCEMSDEAGNLLDNEHLQLLDYLLWRCKERGIYAFLTPIAWWGSPERPVGFSTRFTMHQMTTEQEAWVCQCRYLSQFLSHVNPHTGLAYKDDPAVVCIEPINEPIYPPGTSDEVVVRYINALVDAIRSTGCAKPVFFNCWGGREQAVAASKADGPSRQWYPTGLLAGAALWGNFLPRVARYPDLSSPALAGKARVIYEFDAADVPGSYMYPAMARGFREAGAQVAAQFQYDCLPTAPYNLCWKTHYLNLVYAPAKALSFAIASRAFHLLPRGESFGAYPANSRFGDFRVSYEEDLSELASAEEFMYSNDTSTKPPAPEDLRRVWGCGSSPVVQYEGTGGYFLDRLGPGCWRLEVFPDVAWVGDPYGSPTINREVSRIFWVQRAMTVRLPDLGPDFTARRLAPETSPSVTAVQGRLAVRHGVWLLTRRDTAPPTEVNAEYVCPAPRPSAPPTAWCILPQLWRAGMECPVWWFTAALADREPYGAQVWIVGEKGNVTTVDIPRVAPYRFEGKLPASALRGTQIQYALALRDGERWQVLPAGQALTLSDLITASTREEVLWQVSPGDAPTLAVGGEGVGTGKAAIEEVDGKPTLRVEMSSFGPPPSAAGVTVPCRPVPNIPTRGWALCLEARSLQAQTTLLEVTVRQKDGAAFGYNFPLSPTWEKHRVPLTDLRPMWNTTGKLDLGKARQISLTFGAWLYESTYSLPHAYEVRRIYLQPVTTYSMDLLPDEGPLPLVGVPGLLTRSAGKGGSKRLSVGFVAGSDPRAQALRLVGGPFGPEPDCVGLEYYLGSLRLPAELASWRRELAGAREAVFIARAGQPHTTAIEIVFMEEDGSPWGLNLPLTIDWRETRLPLAELKHWSHWRSGPEERGGPGDHFHPDKLISVGLRFGAWLYGEARDEAHVIDLQLIGIE